MLYHLEEVLITISIGYFIYKIFELFGLRRERITLVDRIESKDIIEFVKLMPMGIGLDVKHKLDDATPEAPTPFKMWPIRCGFIMLGFGFGVIIGICILKQSESSLPNREVLSGCVCLGIGLGFIISSIIEAIIKRKQM